MIEFSHCDIEKSIVHFVGNKLNQGNLVLSTKGFRWRDPIWEDKLRESFFKPMHREMSFRFSAIPPLDSGFSMKETAEKVFQDPSNLMEVSMEMAKHLYECATNARIRNGHLFIFYLKNVFVDETVCDAIAIYKTESLEQFVSVASLEDMPEVNILEGYPLGKIDKACIIFNTEREDGYRAVLIDAFQKLQEANYWRRDFLNMEQLDEGYVPTMKYMEMLKGFSQDMMTEDNEVSKEQQLNFLKNTEDFFSRKDVFDVDEFAQEVIIEPSLADAFLDYKEEFETERQIPAMDRFQISSKAFHKNSQKFFRSVIKLDKNFHIYVHGNGEFIERGVDEEKGLSYYKLYFKEEA